MRQQHLLRLPNYPELTVHPSLNKAGKGINGAAAAVL